MILRALLVWGVIHLIVFAYDLHYISKKENDCLNRHFFWQNQANILTILYFDIAIIGIVASLIAINYIITGEIKLWKIS